MIDKGWLWWGFVAKGHQTKRRKILVFVAKILNFAAKLQSLELLISLAFRKSALQLMFYWTNHMSVVKSDTKISLLKCLEMCKTHYL